MQDYHLLHEQYATLFYALLGADVRTRAYSLTKRVFGGKMTRLVLSNVSRLTKIPGHPESSQPAVLPR
jgi:hypothetical protein